MTLKVVSFEPEAPLSPDEAVAQAQKHFRKAQDAQIALMSRLRLTESLLRPTQPLNWYRLRALRDEAQEQAERCYAVVDALCNSLAALERVANPTQHTRVPADPNSED